MVHELNMVKTSSNPVNLPYATWFFLTTIMPRKNPLVPKRRHYSRDLKRRVIYQAEVLGQTSTEISINLDIPLRVVQRVKHIWNEIGEVCRDRTAMGRAPLMRPEHCEVSTCTGIPQSQFSPPPLTFWTVSPRSTGTFTRYLSGWAAGPTWGPAQQLRCLQVVGADSGRWCLSSCTWERRHPEYQLGVGWFARGRRRALRCFSLGFALFLLSRSSHDVEGGGCPISWGWTMFWPCWAHVPRLCITFFTPFYSSDSCGFNAYNIVQKEAVIRELFTNYYASGACTCAHHQNQPFLEKNRVRALSSASSCKTDSFLRGEIGRSRKLILLQIDDGEWWRILK